MDYRYIDECAAPNWLQVYGGFHPKEDEPLPNGTKSVLLLGPLEPDFWSHVKSSPEFLDGEANPLDRWSTRTISQIAHQVQATPLFPFGGPPWLPFFKWAIQTGRCWSSPIGLLVHDTAGLLVSFRGGLALPIYIELPANSSQSPCLTCEDRPCLDSCPIDALTETGYDSKSCITHIRSSVGQECLTNGCIVRRSCPISVSFPRSEEQSRFHQEALLRTEYAL